VLWNLLTGEEEKEVKCFEEFKRKLSVRKNGLQKIGESK
jgi:hypothetical protein